MQKHYKNCNNKLWGIYAILLIPLSFLLPFFSTPHSTKPQVYLTPWGVFRTLLKLRKVIQETVKQTFSFFINFVLYFRKLHTPLDSVCEFQLKTKNAGSRKTREGLEKNVLPLLSFVFNSFLLGHNYVASYISAVPLTTPLTT